MTVAQTAPNQRLLAPRHRRAGAAHPVLAVGGSMISLFGVGLAIISFSTLDGGDLFLFASLGLIASGALLARRNAAGVWTYMAVFLATLVWSLHGVGLGGSPLGYRIAGPIIMLGMLALLMPALLRWSRRRTVSVLAVLIVATVMVGDLASSAEGPLTNSKLAASQFLDAHQNGVLQ
jgi:glucose dehydrogenase